jgi:hypothetical protein
MFDLSFSSIVDSNVTDSRDLLAKVVIEIKIQGPKRCVDDAQIAPSLLRREVHILIADRLDRCMANSTAKVDKIQEMRQVKVLMQASLLHGHCRSRRLLGAP